MLSDLVGIPYRLGGSTRSGLDCWGLAELAYRERFGIDLAERSATPDTSLDTQCGFDSRSAAWYEVAEPADYDVVTLRTQGLDAGHVGLYFRGMIVHCVPDVGVIAQGIGHRMIRGRISGVYRHRDTVNRA